MQTSGKDTLKLLNKAAPVPHLKGMGGAPMQVDWTDRFLKDCLVEVSKFPCISFKDPS